MTNLKKRFYIMKTIHQTLSLSGQEYHHHWIEPFSANTDCPHFVLCVTSNDPLPFLVYCM